MKTIITTVGTSIFTNLIKNDPNSPIIESYENLKDKKFSEWDADDIEDRSATRKGLRTLVKEGIQNSSNASAEIETILKIVGSEQTATIHLLTTDTVLSFLASELIKDWFNAQPKYERWTFIIKKIDKLNVQSKSDFEDEGFMKLIEVVREIEKPCSIDNRPILNISGGYKAIIPPLTLMGQLYNMPLNYIYEDSGQLIEFGNLPIQFDWEIAEELAFFLDEAVLRDNDFLNNQDSKAIIKKLTNNKLIDKSNKITPLGKFFKNYVEKKTPESKTTIGVLVEYKMLEYYKNYDSRLPKGFNVIRSEDLVKNGRTISEIDLIFEDPNDKNNIITTEIKSFYQVANYQAFHNGYVDETGKQKKSVKEQFRTQLEYVKDEWQIDPIEVKYLVYQASSGYNTPKSRRMLSDNLKVLAKIVFDVFGKNVPFYVDLLNIPLNQNKNSFTEFLQHRIQKTQLIEDFKF